MPDVIWAVSLLETFCTSPATPAGTPYFLTGAMDAALYDPDCEFADPFTSFRGRDRFVANLENLAGRPVAAGNAIFLISMKIIDFQ